jgi:cobalt/nickel transport system permease protein
MHIPDGFLDVKTAAASAVVSGAGLALALRWAQRTVAANARPLMGLAAAFIFAAQMLNFPVLGGTSGHLMGAVLAAALLGPAAAVVVMTAVLIVQCFLFNDGGVLSLGANLFNMAIAAPVAGGAVYALLKRTMTGQRGVILAAFVAAWFSTMLAATCCAGQLALSKAAGWNVVFPAMFHVHLFIGLGEALITTLILAAILRVRPELLAKAAIPGSGPTMGMFLLWGGLLALGLALFVAPHASPLPDGLEYVAGKLGFEHKASAQPLLPAPLPDYQLAGQTGGWSTGWAGAMGVLVVFTLGWGMSLVLVPAARNEAVHGASLR